MTGPVVSHSECANAEVSNGRRRDRRNAQKNDAARDREASAKSQFAKILVEGEHHPALIDGALQERPVILSRACFLNPHHVVPVAA